MVETLIQFLNGALPYLQAIGLWAYAVLFIAALLESTPGVGTFAPGIVVLLFFGYFSWQGFISFPAAVVVSAAAAVLGDIAGYMLGKYGRKFIKENHGFIRLSHLDVGKAFFIKHGGKSIFLGRFIGPIRPIIPLVAGMTHMPLRRFNTLNILGATVWAIVYLGLGYVFGAQWQTIHGIVSRVGFIAAALIAIFAAFLFHVRRVRRLKKVVIQASSIDASIDPNAANSL